MTGISTEHAPPAWDQDSPSRIGYAAGLAAAAAIADRYGELQQVYADQCETSMPNSIHAFLLQKLMAQRVGAEIRALLPLEPTSV